MCAKTNQNENRVLIFSALLASGFAFVGIALGLWVGSLVIVFDGVYSLISLALTLLSLAAAYYIQQGSSFARQYGRTLIEPLVIAIKAIVILTVVGFSLYAAVSALLTGGREVNPSIATIFGVLNVLGCGYAWWFFAQRNKRYSSGLIDAETKQWQMDTLLSVAVTLGFVSAWLVSLSPLHQYAVYADPMMMLAMSFYFIKVPCEMLIQAVREIVRALEKKNKPCQTVS